MGKKKQSVLESRKKIAKRMPVAPPLAGDIRVDDERIPGAIPPEVATAPLVGPGLCPDQAPYTAPAHRLIEA